MDDTKSIECKCTEAYSPIQIHRYLFALMNRCLPCIQQYKCKVTLGCVMYYSSNICTKCRLLNIRNAYCQFYHEHINIDERKPIPLINTSGFYALVNRHITNYGRNKQNAVDILCIIKSTISCSLSRFSMIKLYPLSYDQILSLIYVGYIPTGDFWRPYTTRYLKMLFRIKLMLERDYKKIGITDRVRKMICYLNRIIEPVATMKFNLYMLRKKKALCLDASNIVESFVM
jgi:hypothetical protein